MRKTKQSVPIHLLFTLIKSLDIIFEWKVTPRVGLVNKYRLKVNYRNKKKVLKFIHASDVIFIVLVYLLLTFSMLLFNKICSIVQMLRLFRKQNVN